MEEQLFDRYRAVARPKGKELLLGHADALRFIEDCRQLGLIILGMDFYRDAGSKVVETLGPADYSDLNATPDAVARSTAAAKRLIEQGFPDGASWVCFTLKGQ